jgi:6-phosphogluconolactonase
MVNIFKSEDAVLSGVADFIVSKAHECITQRDRFNIALSGGNSPKRLYELLASADYKSKIQWNRVFFFFGDERYVPLNDKHSNYLMARKALFEPLFIPDEHIFAVNTSLAPMDAAHDYEMRMLRHFKDPACRFDLILLGLGDNSHTASLFPFTHVLQEQKSLVKETYVDEVKMYRITFTAPLINAAHDVLFLVFGSSKAEAVHNILEGEENMEAYPAQLIKPGDGVLHWYLDEAAAGRLSPGKFKK